MTPPGPAQRRRIGYVPQHLTVGGGIPSTVEEVVASGRLSRRPWYARQGAADRAAVTDAIAAVGLTERRRAQQVARSFRTSLAVAVTVGVAVSVLGTGASFYLGTPSGGTIVLLAVAVFVLSAAGSGAGRAVHARRNHSSREHLHEHGLDCGHPPVPHGDHVNYVHDGHRHAAHGSHWDDH